MPTPKPPSAKTRQKIERALTLLREAVKDPNTDFSACGHLSSAITYTTWAQEAEKHAELRRRDNARQQAEWDADPEAARAAAARALDGIRA